MRAALAVVCLVQAANGLLTGPAMVSPAASSRAAVSMKVFAWKVRGEEAPTLEGLDMGSLSKSPGSAHRRTRKGRGVSAGQGVTCGFGNRGQKSRSGRSVRPGFEGGQIPLYRRIPKFVGRPMGPGHTRIEYEVIKLSALNQAAEGAEVDYASLLDLRAVSKPKLKISKVVGSQDKLTVKGLKVKAHAFTETARLEIEALGGTCITLSRTTNKAIGAEEAEPAAAE
jgi:large subunit ribosomal protein L15